MIRRWCAAIRLQTAVLPASPPGSTSRRSRCLPNLAPHPVQRQVKAAASETDQLVDFGVADHQRRRDNHAVAYGAHDQALAEAELAADQARVALLGEGRKRALVRDQLQRSHEAEAARLADQRVIA